MTGLEFNLKWQRERFSLDVQLVLPSGVNVLFGPSGSGKTTVLRFLAGLDQETVDEGGICVGEVCWYKRGRGCNHYQLECHKRSIGYVFQAPSLLPHLTVAQNLAYAQRRAHGRESVVDYDDIITLLQLGRLLNHKPSQLSGGEAQRVSLARAFLCKPQLLLLDEPLSALGVAHKQELLDFMASLFSRLHIPVVYVTHSLEEVARLADTLTVLNNGVVACTGDAQTVLADLTVAAHLGRDACVFIEGKICEYINPWCLIKVAIGDAQLYFPSAAFPCSISPSSHNHNTVVRLKINASDVSIALEKPQKMSIQNCLEGIVDDVLVSEGDAYCLIGVWVGENKIVARITRKSLSELQLRCGVNVFVLIKSVVITG